VSKGIGIVVVLVALLGGGLYALRAREAAREEARREAVETSRIRGWARSEGGAGLSALPKRVPAADPAELRQLEDLPGFHAYAMRCSSCHVLPDPGAYEPGRWRGRVDAMREHIARAGVMPPEEAELEAATEFLDAASKALRAD
jgi:hypothetical protein